MLAPDLSFPSPRTVRNESLLFVSHLSCGSVLQQPGLSTTDYHPGAGSSRPRPLGRSRSSENEASATESRAEKDASGTEMIPRMPPSLAGVPSQRTLRPSLWTQTSPLQVLLATKNPLWEGNNIRFLFSSDTHANTTFLPEWAFTQTGLPKDEITYKCLKEQRAAMVP